MMTVGVSAGLYRVSAHLALLKSNPWYCQRLHLLCNVRLAVQAACVHKQCFVISVVRGFDQLPGPGLLEMSVFRGSDLGAEAGT